MINVFSLDESEQWDYIVSSFENYDVYYLSSYSKAFKIHGDGEPLLIYYDNKKTKAINVVMKRDISKIKGFQGYLKENEYFDFSTPYGYGGFLIEGNTNVESIEELDKSYTAYCKKNNIISEFVRFHPVSGNSGINEQFYEVIQLGKTISMRLDSKELIWSNISSKNRNVIRKAKKIGVDISWGSSPELFEEFIPMYNTTMEGDNATDYYYFKKDFFDSIMNDLKYNSMIFYAKYDNKLVSMAIILFRNKQIHYHLSGSVYSARNLSATNLMLYEVACWGAENGYKTFHLGGGLGSEEDGLYKFKKAFNRNSDTFFSIGKKIFDLEKYNSLLTLKEKISEFDRDTSYFPAYRI